MAKIAIVTGATGGLGQEFIKDIQKIDEIDEIWAVGRNEKKLEELRKNFDRETSLFLNDIFRKDNG